MVIKENVAAVSPHGVVGSKAVAVHGVFMVLQKEKESPKAIGNGFGAFGCTAPASAGLQIKPYPTLLSRRSGSWGMAPGWVQT